MLRIREDASVSLAPDPFNPDPFTPYPVILDLFTPGPSNTSVSALSLVSAHFKRSLSPGRPRKLSGLNKGQRINGQTGASPSWLLVREQSHVPAPKGGVWFQQSSAMPVPFSPPAFPSYSSFPCPSSVHSTTYATLPTPALFSHEC